MTTSRFFSAAAIVAAFAIAFSGRSAAADPAGPTTGVPILMYHVIADPPARAPYPELYDTETDFARQMRWLARQGYHAVTQRAVWEYWHRGRTLPPKPIVISFDDGYRSVADAAFPLMRARNWPGVINLTVKNLRVSGGLSQYRVRMLLGAGWELASHSLTHPDLTRLDQRALRREVTDSRELLRTHFGVPVDFFCYPAGRYDAKVIAAVRRAGYLGATTTVDGVARPQDPNELRRVRVSGSDGVVGLAEKLGAHGA